MSDEGAVGNPTHKSFFYQLFQVNYFVDTNPTSLSLLLLTTGSTSCGLDSLKVPCHLVIKREISWVGVATYFALPKN